MKKNIAIVLLASGLLVGSMSAMQTGDQNHVTFRTDDVPPQTIMVDMDRARLFGTINDMMQNISDFTKASCADAHIPIYVDDADIPIKVTKPVFEHLLGDIEWVLSMYSVYNNNQPMMPAQVLAMPFDLRKKRAEIAACGLERSLNFEQAVLKKWSEYFKAADYLNIPELMEKYAREGADQIISGESLQLLYENNPEYTAFIKDVDRRDRSALIYKYILEEWVERFILQLDGPIVSVQFSPDGNKAVTATGGHDCVVNIWDMNTGKLVRELDDLFFSANSEPREPAFSPDGTKVVTASYGNVVGVWDAHNGRLLYALPGHTKPVDCAIFSSNGSKLATRSQDGTARIWDMNTLKVLQVLRGHAGGVAAAIFSANGDKIITESGDHTVRIWNAVTGEELHTLNDNKEVIFASNGNTIMTRSNDDVLNVWDVATGKKLWSLPSVPKLTPHIAMFSPENKTVIVTYNGGEVQIRDAATGEKKCAVVGHGGQIVSVVFSLDGSKVLMISDAGTVDIWDVTTGGLLQTCVPHSESKYVRAAFLSDGDRVMIGDKDGIVHVWHLTTGLIVATFDSSAGEIRSIVLSPDGKRVIITGSNNTLVRVWEQAPAHDVDQMLLVHLLKWARSRGLNAFNTPGWAEEVLGTYNASEQESLKRIFAKKPRTWYEKFKYLFGLRH